LLDNFLQKNLAIYNLLSLKAKLIALFVGFIVIPSVVLIFFLILPTSQVIRDVAITSAIKSNEQIIKNLDTFLSVLSKLSEYPLLDNEIHEIMQQHRYQENLTPLEKSRNFRTMNTFAFSKIKSFSPLISSVVLYDPKQNIVMGRSPAEFLNLAYATTEFGKSPWLQTTLNLQGDLVITGLRADHLLTTTGNPVVSVARSIVDTETQDTLGVIVLNVGAQNLERLWMDIQITDSTLFYLTDSDGTIIFSKKTSEIGSQIESVLSDEFGLLTKENGVVNVRGQDSYLISSTSHLSSWNAITIIPTDELFSYINIMLRITVIAITTGILTSLLIAIFIATGITKPLQLLNQKMKMVGEGNLDIQIDDAQGEVGQIARTIRKMLGEINQLIKKIYSVETEKREAEMMALQAQINPHFLYNTLNSIKWLAHLQGASAIENSISSLSSMLSFTAKQKSDFITINEEIKFIKDYLEILSLRYFNKFNIEYKIDPELYEYKTLKFILQPVIENSILHGFEGINRKGILKISVLQNDDTVIFEVSDNGNGIEKKELDKIIKSDEQDNRKSFNSIGISNIKNRIALIYGDGYGLIMESALGVGTTTRITIPKDK